MTRPLRPHPMPQRALQIICTAGGSTRGALRRQDGQGLAEYALILALIALLVVAALTFLKDQVAALFSEVGSAF